MLRKVTRYSFAFLLSAFLCPVIAYGRESTTTENIIDAVALLGFIALGVFMMADPKARRNRFFRVLILIPVISLPSCATIEKSVLFGAGMGGAAGTGAGILVEKSPGSALIGAGVGAVLGAGIGYLLHCDTKGELPPGRGAKKISGGEVPALLPPEASCSRVEAHIDGSRYFGPQIQCEIEKAASWGR